EDFRRDRNPTSVTDERHELALLEELACQRQHFRVTSEFVRHEAAGDEKADEIGARCVVDSQLRRRRMSMLATISFDFRTRQTSGEARFLEPQSGVPQFKVFVGVFDKTENGSLHPLFRTEIR